MYGHESFGGLLYIISLRSVSYIDSFKLIIQWIERVHKNYNKGNN